MTTLIERFEKKYTPITESGCWIWVGTVNGGGYGLLSFGTPPKRYWRMAHRISWEISNGPIPEGLDVLHRCDIPGCVNPNHLFLGTDKDNVHDCIKKNRWKTPKRIEGWKRMGQAKRRLS